MPWQALLHTRERLSAGNLDDWFAALLQRLGDGGPLALAVLGGRLAATPGRAFFAGYQGALRALWPAAPRTPGALCVTENRSTRPADMHTRMRELHLSGRKDFVTAADVADWLLVAARTEEQGTPRLAVAVVRNGATGVRCELLPALPLMPDIGHARLHLDNAPCELLPGDGWDCYVKPFRSLEDLHVLAAMLGWLYGVGHDSGWPQALQLRLLGLLAGCAEVSRQGAGEATTHLLLAGLFAQFAALREEIDAAMSGDWAALWQRDRDLLQIARTARDKRLEKALAALA